MAHIVATIFSVIGLATAILASQVKTIKWVLIFEICANLAMAINFLISDGPVGSLTCFIAAAQTLFNYLCRARFNKIPLWSLPVFSALYAGSAAYGWQGAGSIFPLISIAIFEMAVFSQAKRYRYMKFISNGAWIAYSILISDYSAIFTYVILFASLIISIVRYDFLKKKD